MIPHPNLYVVLKNGKTIGNNDFSRKRLAVPRYVPDINWLFALTCQEKLVGTTIYVSDMNWLFATTVWRMIRGFYSSQCAEECV